MKVYTRQNTSKSPYSSTGLKVQGSKLWSRKDDYTPGELLCTSKERVPHTPLSFCILLKRAQTITQEEDKV